MKTTGSHLQYPLPPHYDPAKVVEVWKVAYQDREKEARRWANQHHIQSAKTDVHKIALIIIDAQNTFCIPGFELFVGGKTGMGAVEDNRRLCEFIYHNLGSITQITATLDTHTAMQIFHPVFLVNAEGEHPAPLTLVSSEDQFKVGGSLTRRSPTA